MNATSTFSGVSVQRSSVSITGEFMHGSSGELQTLHRPRPHIVERSFRTFLRKRCETFTHGGFVLLMARCFPRSKWSGQAYPVSRSDRGQGSPRNCGTTSEAPLGYLILARNTKGPDIVDAGSTRVGRSLINWGICVCAHAVVLYMQ